MLDNLLNSEAVVIKSDFLVESCKHFHLSEVQDVTERVTLDEKRIIHFMLTQA